MIYLCATLNEESLLYRVTSSFRMSSNSSKRTDRPMLYSIQNSKNDMLEDDHSSIASTSCSQLLKLMPKPECNDKGTQTISDSGTQTSDENTVIAPGSEFLSINAHLERIKRHMKRMSIEQQENFLYEFLCENSTTARENPIQWLNECGIQIDQLRSYLLSLLLKEPLPVQENFVRVLRQEISGKKLPILSKIFGRNKTPVQEIKNYDLPKRKLPVTSKKRNLWHTNEDEIDSND